MKSSTILFLLAVLFIFSGCSKEEKEDGFISSAPKKNKKTNLIGGNLPVPSIWTEKFNRTPANDPDISCRKNAEKKLDAKKLHTTYGYKIHVDKWFSEEDYYEDSPENGVVFTGTPETQSGIIYADPIEKKIPKPISIVSLKKTATKKKK